MKSRFNTTLTTGAGASITALLVAGSALAQTAETTTPARSENVLEEVIVTGTLLRNVAPSTSETVSLDETAVAATGALTTPQLLATIPQLTDFNQTPAVTGSNNVQVNINRVNLRGLPGSGGGSSTLVLLNGHRLPGSGIKSTAPDSDILPPSVLERVEAVPDGGSSIYGADAVGGVLNMIPRRRFDGVQVDGHFGVADEYEQYDYGLTVGKDWGSGSAYIAYNHVTHDSIYGADRDYVKNINWTTGNGAEANCSGNVVVSDSRNPQVIPGSTFYVVSGNTLALGRNFCDRSGLRTIYPTEDRDAVFGSFMQDLGEHFTVDVQAWYTKRENESDEGPRSSSAGISAIVPIPPTFPPNPNFRPAPGSPLPVQNQGQSVQIVYTQFGPQIDHAENEVFGIAPSLTWKLPHDWQMRALLNYGETVTEVANPQINAVTQGTVAALGQFNPYDLSLNSSTVLNSIGNWQIYGRAEQELDNARVVFDGPLVSLPGGELRLAAGAEYVKESYSARTGQSVPGQESTIPLFESSRNTKAAFVEANVPIFGEKNAMTMMHSLTLSASARYDDYSDFGDTTNPTFGLNWEPAEWIALRGRWGTAFQAPSLADTAAADNAISQFPSNIIVNPSQPPTPSQSIEFAYQGGVSNIQPQEADTWSAGFDITPTFLPDLTLSATYYNIDFDGVVSIPPVFIPAQFFAQFQSLYQMAPLTTAQITTFLAQEPSSAAQNTAIMNQRGGAPSVYMLLDARRRNLGSAHVSGIDVAAHYTHKVSFGSIYADLNSTYRLEHEESATAGAPMVSRVDSQSRLRYTLSLGTNVGEHFRGQATYLSNSGFDLTPSVQNGFQTEISSFHTINLYLVYDVHGTGFTRDLGFSLSVNNVTDHDPPLYQGVFSNLTFGYGNGGTVGRLYQLGVSKKF